MSEAIQEPGNVSANAKPAKKPEDREYIVLYNGPAESSSWEPTARIKAASAKAAIQKAYEEDGTYVAVPARSWQPQVVSTEQKATLRFGS